MSDLLKDAEGHNSSKRWFGAACFVMAAGLTIADLFPDFSANVELVKVFLWVAATALVGGTAAEKIKDLRK